MVRIRQRNKTKWGWREISWICQWLYFLIFILQRKYIKKKQKQKNITSSFALFCSLGRFGQCWSLPFCSSASQKDMDFGTFQKIVCPNLIVYLKKKIFIYLCWTCLSICSCTGYRGRGSSPYLRYNCRQSRHVEVWRCGFEGHRIWEQL